MNNEILVPEAKPLSRQRKWQNRRLAEGRCVRCGQKRNLYAQRCDSCQSKETERAREKNECREWRTGSRGRRPKTHSETE